MSVLGIALRDLKAAYEFAERVKRSPADERAAVGADHHEWLESATRNVVEAIGDRVPDLEGFQADVECWVMSCFGLGVLNDLIERRFRFIEEALELVQSTGMTIAEVREVIDHVYSRPPGDPKQEVAGSMITLLALACCQLINTQDATEAELARVIEKNPTISAKGFNKPKEIVGPSVLRDERRKRARRQD